MLRLEGGAALLGAFQFLLALLELLVHEAQRLDHVALVAGEVFLAEDVDHLLGHVMGQLGIFGIREGAVIRRRADLE